MKHTLYKFLTVLVVITANASLSLYGQNTPNSQTAPDGAVTEPHTVPPVAASPGLYNYTRTFVPKVPITNEAQVYEGSPASEVSAATTFTDGFQRPMLSIKRSVHVNGTGSHFNLIQPIDTRFQNSNDACSYLPYASTDWGYAPNAFAEQKTYYDGLYPGELSQSFSKTKTESDAGSRKSTSYAPGRSNVGQGRGTTNQWITNAANEIRIWKLDGSGLPVSTAFYAAGTLTGDFTANSSGAEVYSYSDKAGRAICKTILLNTVASGQGVTKVYGTTYYIYDELGRLRYVLPPKATDLTAGGTITQTQLDNLCYQYTYDKKGMKITEKLPGKAIEGFVYDQRNRLVMRQDGILRNQQQWEFIFYDPLDRPTVTGLANSTRNRMEMDTFVNSPTPYPSTSFLYYIKNYDTWHTYPATIGGITYNSFTYYDDYNITDPGDTLWNTYASILQFIELQGTPGAETPSKTLRTRGLVTGHKVRLIPAFNAVPSKVGDWKKEVIYYDEKARPIYTVSKDFYQGSAIHESYSGIQYDFSGKALVSKHIVKTAYGPTANQPQTELIRNIYDANTGQPTSISHKVNSGNWKVLVSYEYDELGRIKREVLGNSGEVRDYSYNIRGQLSGINDIYAETGDKEGLNRTFGQSLKYDYGFSQKEYNGQVAGMIWRGSNSNRSYAYGYDYDRSGRLTTADFRTQFINVPGWTNNLIDYSVSNLTYDKGGNILSMNQRGVQPGVGPVNMDVLSYNYENSGQSNRLQYVNDAGVTPYGAGDFSNSNTGTNDYTYDVNGNITSDLNKGISTANYTIWNKPNTILFSSGTNFQYSYDGLGKKLQERHFTATGTTVTDYIENFVFKNDTLQYILTPVGRTLPDGKEEFFVKDHLGNIRSTIDVTSYVMQEYLATFEVASANLEGLFFDYIDEVRDQNPSSTDPNNEYSARLNGGDPGHEIGASLLMKVMTGDHINVNVNNFYEGYQEQEDVPLTVDDMLDIIVTTLKAGNGGWTGSESHNTNLVDRLFTPSNYTALQQIIDNTANDPSKPKAYLNYILFDEHMNIVPEMSGAYQANGSGSWTGIGTGTAKTIPTNGYFAVFLTNKSKITGCLTCGDVFFDQLVVQVNKSNLLEENHYYPYGLPIVGLSSTAFDFKENRYKYQGNEYLQKGLNWMDFHNRQYDPQIGRFLSVDPLAASTARLSPYTGMNDNPVSTIDPLGLAGNDVITTPLLNKLFYAVAPAMILRDQNSTPSTWQFFADFNRTSDEQRADGLQALARDAFWDAIVSGTASVSGGIVTNTNLGAAGGGDDDDKKSENSEQLVEISYTEFTHEVKDKNGNYLYTESGVEAQFGIKGGTYAEYQWLQTISTNSPDDGKTSPYLDEAKPGFFFYQTFAEQKALKPELNRLGLVAYFFDGSSRDVEEKNVQWSAQLTLIGRMKAGDSWTPISTIEWGWNMVDKNVTKIPWTVIPFSTSRNATYLNQINSN